MVRVWLCEYDALVQIAEKVAANILMRQGELSRRCNMSERETMMIARRMCDLRKVQIDIRAVPAKWFLAKDIDWHKGEPEPEPGRTSALGREERVQLKNTTAQVQRIILARRRGVATTMRKKLEDR